MTTIVFVASYLGPAHGGINVFNAELLAALQSRDGLRTVCLVPSTECVDNSFSHVTEIIPLRGTGSCFSTPAEDAPLAAQLLSGFGTIHAVVGHDVVTGDFALEVADAVGAKKILIHHMSYGRYIALMREPDAARAKERSQQKLFPRADQCFAVGPLLLDSLRDIQRSSPGMRPPKLLLPPLVETSPALGPRNAPRILYSGRIEDSNDPVKQGGLAARAIGRALRSSSDAARDASVDIYGFEVNSPLIADFRKSIESEAGRRVPVKCLPFIDSRAEMLEVVRDASLVVMPSVHEGFGLVAWEAMCCCVPLLVSRNSGFFQFIESLGLAKYVDAVSVHDYSIDDDVRQQVDELAAHIRSRIEHPEDAHRRADKLLASVRSQGAIEAALEEFVIDCGHVTRPASAQTRSTLPLVEVDPLDVNLMIEVDVGLNDQDDIEYRCKTSSRRIASAMLASRNGFSGVGVSVSSTYLDRLLEMARSDTDPDRRAEAAVTYKVDQAKITKLGKFLDQAFAALASPKFASFSFQSDCDRAAAFTLLVDGLNGRRSGGDRTWIDAVRRKPYMTFVVGVPTDVISRMDFFEPLFTISAGATLCDLWLDCSAVIAAAYLQKCMAESIESGNPPPPLGEQMEWRIGSH